LLCLGDASVVARGDWRLDLVWSETSWPRVERPLGLGAGVCGLAVSAGFFVASMLEDPMPPCGESASNELAWDAFLLFGAVTLVLGAVVELWYAMRTVVPDEPPRWRGPGTGAESPPAALNVRGT
jgi:hypothetical protein